MDTWIHNLVQRVQTELPLDLRMQHVRTQLVSAQLVLLMIRYSGAVTNPHSTSRVPLLQLGYALHVKQWKPIR